jgi:hypothetical protein
MIATYPALMVENPRLVDYANSVDNAIALALNPTSYVSSARTAIALFRCERTDEPRDALDKVILAWEKDDRIVLEATLGPTVPSESDEPVLQAIRAGRWSRSFGVPVQVGYRFTIPGRWSEPEETFEVDKKKAHRQSSDDNPQIATVFTNSSGAVCGKLHVKFLSVPETPLPAGPQRYFINAEDLGSVIQVTASCADNAMAR